MNEVVKLKRGAQPGNRNARKHGFYSSVLDDSQKQALKQASAVKGLDEEIDILRLKIKSLVKNDPDNIQLISQATLSLARLIKISEKLESAKQDKLYLALKHVVEDVAVPLGLNLQPLYNDIRKKEAEDARSAQDLRP